MPVHESQPEAIQQHSEQESGFSSELETSGASASFADGNPNVASQMKMQSAANSSPQVQNQAALQRKVDAAPQVQQQVTLQRNINASMSPIQASMGDGELEEGGSEGGMMMGSAIQGKMHQSGNNNGGIQMRSNYQVNPLGGPLQRNVGSPLTASAPALFSSSAAPLQRNTAPIQRVGETTPSVNDGIQLDVLGDLKSMSKTYAIEVIKRELTSNETIRDLMIRALNYAITSLANLAPWLELVRQVWNALQAVASIPEGVVSVFLWGCGKLFLWVADKLYNGGRIAGWFGDVTENGLYTVLSGVGKGHQAIKGFVEYVEYYVTKIVDWLASGKSDEKVDKEEDEPTDPNKGDTPSFLNFNVETPEIAQYTMSDTSTEQRAGLQAKGSAHVNLFGQQLGGDFDFKLPFGTGWEAEVAPFFKTSEINLPGLKIGNLMGDSMIVSNKGLEKLQMSANNFSVAGDVVTGETLKVTYLRKEKSLEFQGVGSAALWDGKRLDGDIGLTLGTNGAFKKGHIQLTTGDTFEAIPNYLDIISPGGRVDIYADKAPDVLIQSGILVKGLPGGITARANGGVKYIDSTLTGFVKDLDIKIPLTQGSTVTIVVIDAEFSKQGLTAKRAYMDYDYKKPDPEADDNGVEKESIFGQGMDLSWLSLPGTEVNELSLRAGLTSLKIADGKVDFEKDETAGLRKLDMRVLGVGATYDAEQGKGSLEGQVEKEIGGTLAKVDFPTPIPGVGGSLEIGGVLGFGAGLKGTLQHNPERSDDTQSVIKLGGEVNAKAYSGLKLSVGVFAGIPYLANIKGSLFGQITGTVEGKIGMSGGLIYDKDAGRIKRDPEEPVKGDFELKGGLSAKVGAEIKAQILVFEKTLAKFEFGDWDLGSYTVFGTMESDEDGKPTFTIDTKKSGFLDNEDPTKGTPPPSTMKDMRVDQWLDEAVKAKTKITYQSNAESEMRAVVREIVYGRYSNEQQIELMAAYKSILGNPQHPTKAQLIYAELREDTTSFERQSFIWSKDVWKESVKMRKILFWDQSKSKRKVYDLLEEYHKLGATAHEARLSKMAEIKNAVEEYIPKSKDDDNVAEARQMLRQIKLEQEAISLEAATAESSSSGGGGDDE